MPTPITASMLYDLVLCPHRVHLDLYGDSSLRDPVSPFVRLLWERGALHERQAVADAGLVFTDLSGLSGPEKEEATVRAMARGDALIYSGRIRSGDLLGVPDLLRKAPGGYLAGDIKSGAALSGGSDPEGGKYKASYAVQLALYTDILEKLGRSAGRTPFILDIHGEETAYDLERPQGPRKQESWWMLYLRTLAGARRIVHRTDATLPAYASATCKNCHWYSACMREVRRTGDLTLIPGLGRTKRDTMRSEIRDIHQMAHCRPGHYIRGDRTVFRGVGPATLNKFRERAELLIHPDAGLRVRGPIAFPKVPRELFYDVETDPFEGVCYLHGFVERISGDPPRERYVPFFAEAPTPEAEEDAFRGAWAFLSASHPCAVYYYSKYERTALRKLAEKYPGVTSVEAVETFFGDESTVDLLFDIVERKTEWPCIDHSIKTLATYLGFRWRDENPSGAASIEWYHRFLETGDTEIRKRILAYNEDDCAAMRVLLEGIRERMRSGAV